jgi:hypothetical protein
MAVSANSGEQKVSSPELLASHAVVVACCAAAQSLAVREMPLLEPLLEPRRPQQHYPIMFA